MKRTIKTLLSVVLALSMIACSAFALVGCDKNKEVEFSPEGIKEAKMTGLEADYTTASTIDWTKLELTLTYENGDYKVKNYEFDVESATKEDTEVIVYTEGLYAEKSGELTEGVYNITLKAVGGKDSFALKTVTVAEISSENSTFVSFEDSAFVTEYRRKIENNDATSEGGFKSVAEAYTIGDDNAFKFAPVLSVMVDGKLKTFSQFKAEWTVKEVNGETKAEASADLYTVNGTEIDFAEDAVGKTFEISVKPVGFDSAQAKTLTVKVEDGWNMYNALDLGLLNINNGLNNVSEYEYFYDAKSNDSHGAHKQFYNKETGEYGYGDYSAFWTNFLTAKGYDLTDFTKINGAFVHGNIAVTEADIPSEFFITAAESPDGFATGRFRDGAAVYYIVTTPENGFTFNGNYFKIDASAIRGCRSQMGNNDKGNFEVYLEGENAPYGSKAVLFCPVGKYGDRQNVAVSNINFKNVDTKGNTGADTSGEAKKDIDKVTGLIFIKARGTSMNFVNNIVKEYFIGIFPEKTSTTGDYKNATVITDSKVYDCFQTAIFTYNAIADVRTSEFKRFGGPATMVDQSWYKDLNPASMVKFDNDTVVENFVNGTEAWFALQGATEIATNIISLYSGYETYGKTIVKDGKFNLVSVIMEAGGITSTDPSYRGTFTKGNNFALTTYADADNQQLTAAYSMFAQVSGLLGSRAPVAITNGGSLNIIVPQGRSIYLVDGVKVTKLMKEDPTGRTLGALVQKVMGGTATAEEQAQIMQTTAIKGDLSGILLPVGSTTFGAVVSVYDKVQA